MVKEHAHDRHQVSNSHSVMVENLRVTAILDSFLEFPASLVIGTEQSEVEKLNLILHRGQPSKVTINGFLVEGEDFLALVDTGFGGVPEPTKGRLAQELKTLGVQPGDITHVLLTHLHADHAGGAVTPDGACAFPNAVFIAHEAERAFWYSGQLDPSDELLMEQYQTAAALMPFHDRFQWVAPGEILPGVELVHLPGHTPGHSGFRIKGGADSLLIWGDIVHQPALQLLRPELGVAFDVDPKLAQETRWKLFNEVANSGELIAGMHLDFPAFGRLIKTGDKTFSLSPKTWSPVAHSSSFN